MKGFIFALLGVFVICPVVAFADYQVDTNITIPGMFASEQQCKDALPNSAAIMAGAACVKACAPNNTYGNEEKSLPGCKEKKEGPLTVWVPDGDAVYTCKCRGTKPAPKDSMAVIEFSNGAASSSTFSTQSTNTEAFDLEDFVDVVISMIE